MTPRVLYGKNKLAVLYEGNCLDVMRTFGDNSIDSIVTDPPYELGFMGKAWDASGIANSIEMWTEALRVLKPGGHLLAFSGSRTYHRMTCAIEDAGFEVRDQIMWVYGSGFPKSLNVSKAIDKAAGAMREVTGVRKTESGAKQFADNESGFVKGDINITATDAARQWEGWGTALKPAHEPICVARKPLIGAVVANVLAHGTGALNIDGCRVEVDPNDANIRDHSKHERTTGSIWGAAAGADKNLGEKGRWPANLIHDGSDEVLALFPDSNGSGVARALRCGTRDGEGWGMADEAGQLRDAGTGSAARFFYCAKTSKADRDAGNNHPTVKPTSLMQYLLRLVTPPGGVVLDPFTGSGSTGKAAQIEGMIFFGIDLSAEYLDIAERRIMTVQSTHESN